MFEKTILKDVIDYCLEQIESKKHQKSALLCLGMVVHLVCYEDLEALREEENGKSKMEVYLDNSIIPRLKSVLKEAFAQKNTSGLKVEPAFFKCMELISEGIKDLHDKLWSQKKNRDFINYIIAFGLLEITPEWMKCVQAGRKIQNVFQMSDKLAHWQWSKTNMGQI